MIPKIRYKKILKKQMMNRFPLFFCLMIIIILSVKVSAQNYNNIKLKEDSIRYYFVVLKQERSKSKLSDWIPPNCYHGGTGCLNCNLVTYPDFIKYYFKVHLIYFDTIPLSKFCFRLESESCFMQADIIYSKKEHNLNNKSGFHYTNLLKK
jgi:hypothetical protein